MKLKWCLKRKVITMSSIINDSNNTMEEGRVVAVPTQESVNRKNNIPAKEDHLFFCKCLVINTIILIVLGLIGAAVAYYVFSIMALVEDSNESIQKECKNSNIWAYLLTVIIVNLFLGNNSKPSKDGDVGDVVMSTFISLIVLVGLCTWGSIEFWKDCVQDKLSTTLIFKMIEITIYIQYVALGICIGVIVYSCCKISGDVHKTVRNV